MVFLIGRIPVGDGRILVLEEKRSKTNLLREIMQPHHNDQY